MKAKMIMLVAGALVVLAFISYPWGKNQEITETTEIAAVKTLKIGAYTLNIETADTSEKRARGLSEKIELRENEGMLFIFQKEGNYGFWMKDMNFPIDIAWLDKNKQIIHIENAILPKTYPKIFGSNVTSLYVLETQAGFLVKNNVKIGDFVAF